MDLGASANPPTGFRGQLLACRLPFDPQAVHKNLAHGFGDQIAKRSRFGILNGRFPATCHPPLGFVHDIEREGHQHVGQKAFHGDAAMGHQSSDLIRQVGIKSAEDGRHRIRGFLNFAFPPSGAGRNSRLRRDASRIVIRHSQLAAIPR